MKIARTLLTAIGLGLFAGCSSQPTAPSTTFVPSGGSDAAASTATPDSYHPQPMQITTPVYTPPPTPTSAPAPAVTITRTPEALQTPGPAPSAPLTPSAPAQVAAPGSARRDTTQRYLIIAAYKTAGTAKAPAQYLANHGVGVSVEPDHRGYFILVSTQGFPKSSDPAAQALQAHVKQLGSEYSSKVHADKPAWQDAYFSKFRPMPATPTPASRPS